MHSTGMNRGYGFCDFESRADAQKAMDKYQGYEFMGRPIRLDWDLGRRDQPPPAAGSRSVLSEG